jgi:hypothetical protein
VHWSPLFTATIKSLRFSPSLSSTLSGISKRRLRIQTQKSGTLKRISRRNMGTLKPKSSRLFGKFVFYLGERHWYVYYIHELPINSTLISVRLWCFSLKLTLMSTIFSPKSKRLQCLKSDSNHLKLFLGQRTLTRSNQKSSLSLCTAAIHLTGATLLAT